MLKLQTDIATAVAEALKVTLLGDVSAKIELGGTRNPAAFDAYLRGARRRFYHLGDPSKDEPTAIAAYTEAIRLDPNYALAFAGPIDGSLKLRCGSSRLGLQLHEGFEKAKADALRAIALAPELAKAHLALANVFEQGPLEGSADFAQASEEYERALALAPGDAQVVAPWRYLCSLVMGHFDAAIAATRRAVVLDPLADLSRADLSTVLYLARQYGDAASAYAAVLSLNPDYQEGYGERGLVLLELGGPRGARAPHARPSLTTGSVGSVWRRYTRSSAGMPMRKPKLAKLKATYGDAAAYQYATIYAQWGDHAQALQSLDTAMRVRDPGLIALKTDPLMDPLRQEPRFQAILRKLNFPGGLSTAAKEPV